MSGRNLVRVGAPWLFVEFVAIAAWLKDGDTIAAIALRLRRSNRQVRAIAFGDDA